MALTPKPRSLADGTTVWDVKWRLRGGSKGPQKTETFNPKKNPKRDLKAAQFFALAVESNGYDWPVNYLPGIGFVTAAQAAAIDAAQGADDKPVLLFRDHAKAALARMAPGIESGTLARYHAIVRNHLEPKFGEMNVLDPEQISPESIGPWISGLLEGEREDPGDPDVPEEDWPWAREPVSAKTVRNIHGLLYAIMQFLVDAEVPKRSRNPCADTSLPSLDDGEDDEEMMFLDPEEFAILHGWFDDAEAADLTEWLYGTGERFSEATAHQVRDFELEGPRPRVRVRRAWKQSVVKHAKNNTEKKSYYLGAPKTKASVRWIALTRRQVEMIRPRLEGKRPTDLVFTGPAGGRWTHSTFYTGRWRPALYRAMRCVACRGEDYAAGIGRRGPSTLRDVEIQWCGHEGTLERKPRVHDLRHSHVAVLIAIGVQLFAISRRLGHKSIQITYDRYGHLLPEVEDDMTVALDARLSRVGFAAAA